MSLFISVAARDDLRTGSLGGALMVVRSDRLQTPRRVGVQIVGAYACVRRGYPSCAPLLVDPVSDVAAAAEAQVQAECPVSPAIRCPQPHAAIGRKQASLVFGQEVTADMTLSRPVKIAVGRSEVDVSFVD